MIAQKENRMKVIEHLIKSGVKIEQIPTLTVGSLTTKGIVIEDKTVDATPVFKELVDHVKRLTSELLFPGKQNTVQSVQNLLNAFSSYLKETGRKLSDLGLTTPKPVKEEIKIDTMDELVAFVKARQEKVIDLPKGSTVTKAPKTRGA